MALQGLSDTVEVDASQVFSTPIRTGWWARLVSGLYAMGRIPRPVILVGRNVTSDSQTYDPIIDSLSRLKVDGGVATGTLTPWTSANWIPANDPIGSYVLVSAVAAAGNADAVLGALAAPSPALLYRLLEVNEVVLCGAAVANRTPSIRIRTGLRPATPVPLSAVDDWVVTAGTVLTQGQDGSLMVPPAPGVITQNANGVISTQAISPLGGEGLMVSSDVAITSRVALGAAGDSHNVFAVLRRVA